MSTAKIQSALEKTFARQRLVFWYDETAEWWPEFDGVQLPDVEKVTVQNNEFAIKHRITREAPQQKFLLYFRGQKRPADTENWLLDQLLLSGDPFMPGRASLALMDVGLPPEFEPLAAAHLEFFRSAERVAKLREWLKDGDGEADVLLKMTAVICRTEPTVESILLSLLSELSRDKADRWAAVEKYGLATAWWQQLAGRFGYVPGSPSVLDFALSLFRAVTPLGASVTIDPREALVFLNRWKDSEEYRETFEILSERADGLLNVSAALNQIEDVRPLLTQETYRRIDMRIIADLRDGLVGGGMAPAEARKRAEERTRLHWARHDRGILALYQALACGAEFIESLSRLDLTIESFDAGVAKYASHWYRMDQVYRKFIFHFVESSQTAVLEGLALRIEGLYVNEFLGTLAQRWQEWVDRCTQWTSGTIPRQCDLIPRFVKPHLAEGRKVMVVVSDALRYEVGQALLQRILGEDRWTGSIQPLLGVLPSVTQLGMAALLPRGELEFAPDGKTVVAEGVNTVGTYARGRILAAGLDDRATALSAEEFLALNSKTDGRELTRGNDVVFVYHNAIDAVGDKRDTEHKTFVAIEAAIEEILRLLKKGAAMNLSHFIVTADHGFLYQHEPLAESDFVAYSGPLETLRLGRRHVVAPVLDPDPRVRLFKASELGLCGNLQFGFPKGVMRLRVQGAGSRFVHGGASLQEVVVPLLEVRKDRASDTRKVGVDIVRGAQQITTGQVTITFLQTEAATEKCLERVLRAGFYSKSGVPVSDLKVMKFDATAEDARQRERRAQFVFGREADGFNQQDVLLRLEEQVAGTSQYATYQEYTFRLKRAFESDFDEE